MSCPFSLIYKKWTVHPDDKSKHPGYNRPKEGEILTDREVRQNDRISNGEGIGVYYLAKFRGFHNHAIDMNMMREENTVEMVKRRIPGRAIMFCENSVMMGHFL